MNKTALPVLVVEDEILIAMALTAQLEELGFQVCAVASDVKSAIREAIDHKPAIVLMDVRLRGGDDGVEAALAIQAQLEAKIIFVTGSREQSTLDRIATTKPFATLFKPLSDVQLEQAMREASQ